MSLRVQVVQRLRLNGTIDGHDPLAVTFRIQGRRGWFRLTIVTVNLGRGYTPEQFRANVQRLLDHIEDRKYVVLLLQEIDEADPSPEHKVIRRMVVEMFGDAAQFVQWATREPIVVIGEGIEVTHSRKTMTMDQGSTIGFRGLGPRRFITYCIALIEGVRIGVACQHPQRYSQKAHKGVAAMLSRGERVTRTVLGALTRVCDLVIDGGDLNTPRYPLSVPGQRVAYHVGLDYIRYTIGSRKRKP